MATYISYGTAHFDSHEPLHAAVMLDGLVRDADGDRMKAARQQEADEMARAEGLEPKELTWTEWALYEPEAT